jgi:hypothetical protein
MKTQNIEITVEELEEERNPVIVRLRIKRKNGKYAILFFSAKVADNGQIIGEVTAKNKVGDERSKEVRAPCIELV